MRRCSARPSPSSASAPGIAIRIGRPVAAITTRARRTRPPSSKTSPGWIAATWRSLAVAFFTGVLATVLGTAAAFVLVRQKLFGRTAVLTLVLSPLILPRLLTALALFYFFAKLGIVGTNLGLIIGHTVLAVPYVVITVMAVLRNFDMRQEHAAWSLGAGKWRTFWHITLPQIRAGVLAGFLFAFITSFDDLTIALFISGGLTSTLPKQMWNDLLLNVNPILASVSTIILLLVSAFILAAEFMRRRAIRGTRRPGTVA